MKTNKFLWLIFTALSLCIFSFCTTNTKKDESPAKNVISEELHQAHCDLLAKANKELANINQKVRDLNDKISEKGGKLTDEQNAALDEFEAQQASINKRVHEIKNVRQEEWENFKTTFEKDLVEINASIDSILKEF